MEVGVAVSGSYANVCRFLEQVRMLKRLHRVVQFEVRGAKQWGECHARFTLWIYFERAAEAAEKGANHA